ncbi:MAG: hypothetical protein Q9220_004417 [cf. Caloplaca sp. 1 TL-2023]
MEMTTRARDAQAGVTHSWFTFSTDTPSSLSGGKQGREVSSNAENPLTHLPGAPSNHAPHHDVPLTHPEATGCHDPVKIPAVHQTGPGNLPPLDAGPSAAAMNVLLTARSYLKTDHPEEVPSGGEVVEKRGGSSVSRGRKRTRRSSSSTFRESPAFGAQLLDGSRESTFKRPRGRPRTRFHPSVGHPGISHGHENEMPPSNSPITVSSSTSRKSSQDSKVASHVNRTTLQPPSCHEYPEYWSTSADFDFRRDVSHVQEKTIHSAPSQSIDASKGSFFKNALPAQITSAMQDLLNIEAQHPRQSRGYGRWEAEEGGLCVQ